METQSRVRQAHHARVAVRGEGEARAGRRGRHAGHVDVVLDRDRHAKQGKGRAGTAQPLDLGQLLLDVVRRREADPRRVVGILAVDDR